MIHQELVDFPAREISPQAVIDFRPSPENQAQFEALIAANKSGQISRDEQRELEQFLMIEHIMQLLKAKARVKQIRDGESVETNEI